MTQIEKISIKNLIYNRRREIYMQQFQENLKKKNAYYCFDLTLNIKKTI